MELRGFVQDNRSGLIHSEDKKNLCQENEINKKQKKVARYPKFTKNHSSLYIF